MCRKLVAAAIAVGAVISATGFAAAATATGNLSVTLTITNQCTVAGGSLAFGSVGLLSSAVTANGTFTVTCTNSWPYTVGLNQGSTAGATVTNRLLAGSGGATVQYGLYQNVGLTTAWGNSAGSWYSGTGNGSAQTLTVYGQVPVQTTPAAGSYTDTVTITVTY